MKMKMKMMMMIMMMLLIMMLIMMLMSHYSNGGKFAHTCYYADICANASETELLPKTC